MIVDFRDRPLLTRVGGQDALKTVESIIAESRVPFVLDLGDNLATTSWIDELLVPLLERGVVASLVSSSNVTRSHIERVLRARGLAVVVAASREDISTDKAVLIPSSVQKVS